jgi:uncharacterized membrane protein
MPVETGVPLANGRAAMHFDASHLSTAVRTAILVSVSLAFLVYSGEDKRLPSVTPRTWAFLGLSGLATSVTLIIAGALLAASGR